jgi:His-Xaa-Ser system radical SAM maturase HxsB
MDRDTAKRAVDLMLCCPAPNLKVEFQGGEPLMNFDTVRFICDYCEEVKEAGRHIDYVLCSNLASLDIQKLDYIRRRSMFISTSLDGPKFIHDSNRQLSCGSSYDRTVEGIKCVQAELGNSRVSALMTTTDVSLDHFKEIVDEYVRQGLSSIFLRPIRPYGRSRHLRATCSTERFLEFYRRAFGYILELNRGGIKIAEGYARVILTKMLTPFSTGYVDLQSPSGAGIGFVAYDYDGTVYASDEGRMLAKTGDKAFRMGSVLSDSYSDIFGGATIRKLVNDSCVETLPGCCECAFQAYCGADPIQNYVMQGDLVGHRPTSEFCMRNREMIRLFFEYLHNGDDFVRNLFLSWVCPQGRDGSC